ncbi:hypothetical protein OC846_004796 [Tilletia horrida]|uniref:MHD domain-containing protein n=1 Tax=Tilletia horrida TaxID=155126 RepID=A0AAN6GRR2_9BASI|nr:hypothetical protein OC846_004796 [Tilletia horrida]KAK0563082.1 hypothetical protein OC861_004989 [Tilletia horrida]
MSGYAEVFSNAQPHATLPLLQARFSSANRLHKEVVDYLAARRDLEEQYLKQLNKLLQKKSPFFESQTNHPADASSYQPLIDALQKELNATLSIHIELEDKINKHIETPLRSLPSSHPDWKRIKELDDDLAAQIKELNSLESTLDKDRKKLQSTPSSNIKKHSQAINKVNDSQRAYDHALASYATEAPFHFDSYGRIDKARLEALVEAVIQLETAQADAAQKWMKVSEQTTTVALTLDAGIEIRAFLNKAENSLPKADSAPAVSATGTNGRGAAPDGPDDFLANSTSNVSAINAAASTTSLPSINNAADLSVSTVNSRRPPPPPTSSAGGSTLRGALSRLGGGRSKARDSTFGGSTPAGATASVYGTLPEEGSTTNVNDDARSGLGANKRTPSLFRSSRSSTERDRSAGPPPPPASRNSQSNQAPFLTITSDRDDADSGAARGSLMAPLVPTRAGTNPSRSSSTGPAASPSTSGLPNTSLVASPPPVDAEGFSIPPPDRKPWESNGGGEEGTEDLLDSAVPSGVSSRMSTLNIGGGNSLTDSESDRQALEKMRSTLGAPPSMAGSVSSDSSTGVTRRSTTSRRERRSTRAFTAGSTPQVPEEGAAPSDQPASSFTAPMTGTGEGRTGSMLSTTSGFGLGAGAGAGAATAVIAAKNQAQGASVGALSANPFESSSTISASPFASSGAGRVKASITETVNAVFSGPTLSRVQVVGEVQVLLSGGSTSSNKKLKLALTGGPLGRTAPNLAFLSPDSASGSANVFELDTSALLLSGGGSGEARATVLKYQLDLPQQSNEVVPIDLHAQWRCEPTQTSLMVSYRPNSSSRLLTNKSALDDFEVVVPIAPAGSVGNAMLKPSGEWDSADSKLVWTLASSSSASSQPLALGEAGKLLARLAVEKATVPQPVNVRWSVKGASVSGISIKIESDDDDAWSFGGEEGGDVVRLAVSGKFLAT